MPADIPDARPCVVLHEEFLEPMASASMRWPKPFMSPAAASKTSAMGDRASRRPLRCASSVVHEYEVEIRTSPAGRTADGGTGGDRAAKRGVRAWIAPVREAGIGDESAIAAIRGGPIDVT